METSTLQSIKRILLFSTLFISAVMLFASCSYEAENGLQYKRVKGGYEVVGYIGTEKEIVIPDEANGKAVVGIAKEAFAEIDIRSIVISDTVTYIGEMAFYKCKYLGTIELGKGLTEIGSNAFTDCQIKKMNYTGTMEDWFRLDPSCWKLIFREYTTIQGVHYTDIIIPSFITEIPYEAFRYTDITSVVLPDSVETIGAFAFCNCEQLSSVTFGNGLKKIGQTAFFDTALTGPISIPSSVETIESAAFENCEKLLSVYIPASVQTVGSSAFATYGDTTIYCQAESEPFGWHHNWSPLKDKGFVIWNSPKPQ